MGRSGIFIILISFFACGNPIDEKNYLNKLDIQLSDDYQVLDQSYEPAVGDLLVKFNLKLGAKDFIKITNSISSSPNYVALLSSESYPEFTAAEKPQIINCSRENTYYRAKFIPHQNTGYELYQFYLDEDSILSFTYVDE